MGLEELYNEMLQKNLFPDVVTYNLLIHGYSKFGNLHKAFELFDEMKDYAILWKLSSYREIWWKRD